MSDEHPVIEAMARACCYYGQDREDDLVLVGEGVFWFCLLSGLGLMFFGLSKGFK